MTVEARRSSESMVTQVQPPGETTPGVRSQVDRGESWVRFRSGPVRMHLFVLTLGFSRRALLRGLPQRAAGAVPGGPCAGLRALRRPHPGAPL